MVHWAQTIYRRDLEFSQQYRSSDSLPNAATSPALLLEFYFGLADAAEMWGKSEESLVTALNNFRSLPVFGSFRAGATRPGAIVEWPFVVKDKYFSMRGKIDLAYPTDHRFAVVDWKIGDSGDGEESLQLMSYAMAASDKFECAHDDIDLYRVHLRSGGISHLVAEGKQIRGARARIIQDAQKMQALDDHGRSATAEVFTPCGQERICKHCPFQRVCPKELRQDDRDQYSDTDAGA
jgi:PD-(D/E)XK nuclease superfamily